MSLTSAALFMLRPFSSKYIASSAKYFFHGSWLPTATASNNSCVLRTSSSWAIVLPFAGVAEDVAVSSPDTNKSTNRFLVMEIPQSLWPPSADGQQMLMKLDGAKEVMSQWSFYASVCSSARGLDKFESSKWD